MPSAKTDISRIAKGQNRNGANRNRAVIAQAGRLEAGLYSRPLPPCPDEEVEIMVDIMGVDRMT